MPEQFIVPPKPEVRRQQIDLLARLQRAGVALFNQGWHEDSVWAWLEPLLADYQRYENAVGTDLEREAAFFTAVTAQLDFDLLRGMVKQFEQAVSAVSSVRKMVDAVLGEEQINLLSGFDLTPEGTAAIWAKISGLSGSQQRATTQSLKDISDRYDDFRLVFMLVASALLYFVPQGAFATLAHFKEQMAKVELGEGGLADNPRLGVVMLRFLGQGLLGNDGDTQLWARETLMNFTPSLKLFTSRPDLLLYTTILHLSFYNFADQSNDAQEIVLAHSLWSALNLGVPVEMYVRRSLANQPILTDYLIHSVNLSDVCLQSKEPVYLTPAASATAIGDFLKHFSVSAGDNDLDSYKQLQYVEENIRQNHWPADLKPVLLQLINLHLHLRECDLVDYRGWLSDEGLEDRMDWKNLLQHDLDAAELQKIKEYLEMIQRPTRMKMEMIVAFMKTPWKEDPYLSRVLVLNDLYEQVYAPQYSPLVYFDETAGDWKFNKELPEPWI